MRVLLTAILLAFMFFSVSAQPYNQKIPFKVCNIVYDTASCFNEDDTVAIQVSENVTKLDESFRICLGDKVFDGTPPIQVVIAIDKSLSMWSGPGGVPGNDPDNMRIKAAQDFVTDLKQKSRDSSYVGSVIFDWEVDTINSLSPIMLNDAAQLERLMNSIAQGANKLNKIRVLSKTLATNQGTALTTALEMLKELRQTVPGMKQHVIMITDDGWFEAGDIKPPELLATYRAQFPSNAFPQIHSVVLTGDGNPVDNRVQGLANIKLIASETNGLYIEDATPQTIVTTLADILETLTPGMDRLIGVTMKNLSTGESHVMSIDSISNPTQNHYFVGGKSWDLAIGNNSFLFEKTIRMRDSTTVVVYDTMYLTRSHDIDTTILSIISDLVCKTEWPGASFKAIPDSVLVDEVVNAKVQIDPSFRIPYDLKDVSIKGFTTSNPSDPSIISLFKLDSTVMNSISSGNAGEGTPAFNKYRGAFGGSITDGSFQTSVPIPTGDFSFDFWVKSDGNSTNTLISSSAFSLSVDQEGVVTFVSGAVSLKSTVAISSGVWTNIAVARKDGSVSMFINGLNKSNSAAIDFSGDQTVTITAGSGFNIDELRFNSKSNIEAAKYGTVYSIAQITDMNWKTANAEVKGNAVDIPPDTWSGNAVSFSISHNSSAHIILNMTRIDNDNLSWALNSNPLEIVPPFPDPVPVVAEVMDENGNGFIDRITFTIQDSNILAANMPSAEDYFNTLYIKTYDDKDVFFQPENIERVNDKKFTVKIAENNGTTFETGWKSIEILMNDVSVMASGAYTEVVKIIDKAGPVIARALYSYGKDDKYEDTLRIQFSEPVSLVNKDNSPPSELFNYFQRNEITLEAFKDIEVSSFRFESDMMSAVVIMTNGFFILPVYDSIQLRKVPDHLLDTDGNSAHNNSRIAAIEGNARSIITVKPVVNPYIPGTEIPDMYLKYYSNVIKDNNTKVVLVAVKSTRPLGQRDDGTYGDAIIYDCVGNIVQRDVPVYQANSPTDYGFTWDGKNRNNRNVNSGVYLAVIKVYDFFNTEFVFKRKIGIQ